MTATSRRNFSVNIFSRSCLKGPITGTVKYFFVRKQADHQRTGGGSMNFVNVMFPKLLFCRFKQKLLRERTVHYDGLTKPQFYNSDAVCGFSG